MLFFIPKEEEGAKSLTALLPLQTIPLIKGELDTMINDASCCQVCGVLLSEFASRYWIDGCGEPASVCVTCEDVANRYVLNALRWLSAIPSKFEESRQKDSLLPSSSLGIRTP